MRLSLVATLVTVQSGNFCYFFITFVFEIEQDN